VGYLLGRDGVRGQGVGKLCVGLVVINIETGQPARLPQSIKRNVLFVVPGANVAAVMLESFTAVRDPQGQRLGDRMAQTQVVLGLGAMDVVKAAQDWWRSVISELKPYPGRRRPVPADR